MAFKGLIVGSVGSRARHDDVEKEKSL